MTPSETYHDARIEQEHQHRLIEVVARYDIADGHNAAHLWTDRAGNSVVLSAADTRRLRDQLDEILSALPSRPWQAGDRVFPNRFSRPNRGAFTLLSPLTDEQAVAIRPGYDRARAGDGWLAHNPAYEVTPVWLNHDRSVLAD